MTKTKSKKFGQAVSENTSQYHRRKLAAETNFRYARIVALLAAIKKVDLHAKDGIDSLVSKLEELGDHAGGWARFAHSIQKLDRLEVAQSRPDPTDERPHELDCMCSNCVPAGGMEGL